MYKYIKAYTLHADKCNLMAAVNIHHCGPFPCVSHKTHSPGQIQCTLAIHVHGVFDVSTKRDFDGQPSETFIIDHIPCFRETVVGERYVLLYVNNPVEGTVK